MLNLIILMIERVGLIIIVAYMLMNIRYFKTMLTKRRKLSTKVQLILVFGIFAIISNFTGVEIGKNQVISDQLFTTLSDNASLANTRVLTIGVSGLIGGPFVGVSVGFISGINRYMQGGEAAFIYVVSSILIGLFTGLYGLKTMRKNQYPTVIEGIIIGASAEAIQMVCILLLSSNLQDSIELVRLISLPMGLVNSLGTAIFLSIIRTTLQQEEQTKAVQTHDVFKLANETLPFFRQGMNEESCTAAAKIIMRFIKVSAVSITDQDSILAHVGAGSDHHIPSNNILTDLSKEVLKEGKVKEAFTHEEIGCHHNGCPLEAAIVIPLKSKGMTIGVLKMYFTDKNELTYVTRQLAEGLGNIFSSQIELGKVELQGKLLKDAEIKSLQAQVNPHFFFNAINTISALIRVDSEQARILLIQLSHYFRANLQGARTNLIPLEKELEHVQAYLSIEQARFPERYQVDFAFEPHLNHVLLPPFIIQLLVENAIRHAFEGRKKDNHVSVSIRTTGETIVLSIRDNGFGIKKDRLEKLGRETVPSEKGTGSALENLNKRLLSLFGEAAALHIETSPEGTMVSCTIPYTERTEEHAHTNC